MGMEAWAPGAQQIALQPPKPSHHDSLLPWCAAQRDVYLRGMTLMSPQRFYWPCVIVSGAVRIDQSLGSDRPLQLALPGDLLGYEALIGSHAGVYGRAVIDTVVAPLGTVPDAVWQAWLVRQLAAQYQRQADQSALRYGSASDRVRALLMMLARAHGVSSEAGQDKAVGAFAAVHVLQALRELPHLSDIAALTDIAPGTVSRVMTGLRRGGLLSRELQLPDADPEPAQTVVAATPVTPMPPVTRPPRAGRDGIHASWFAHRYGA